jgi:hypothetical protein
MQSDKGKESLRVESWSDTEEGNQSKNQADLALRFVWQPTPPTGSYSFQKVIDSGYLQQLQR